MTRLILAADADVAEGIERLLVTDYVVERSEPGAASLTTLLGRHEAIVVISLVQPLPDFLKRVAALKRRHPEVEIVVVSQRAVPALASLAVLRQGAAALVEHPLDDPERLLATVATVAKRQRHAAETGQLVHHLVDRNYILSRIHELLDEIHRAPDIEALLTGILPALREISGASAVAIVLDGTDAAQAGWPLPTDDSHTKVVPLLLDAHAIGAIHLQGTQVFSGYAFSPEDLFQSLARQLALAIYHHDVLKKAQDKAVRDSLTHLFNHAFFRQGLRHMFDHWKHANRSFAVIMLDLDGFKTTNDAFGHPAGDAVLAAVGREVMAMTRGADIPARYGGDEFGVILADTDATGAALVADRLRQAIKAIRLPGISPVGVSIGVTAVGPADTQANQVLERADTALLQAKALGKNRVCQLPASATLPPPPRPSGRELHTVTCQSTVGQPHAGPSPIA